MRFRILKRQGLCRWRWSRWLSALRKQQPSLRFAFLTVRRPEAVTLAYAILICRRCKRRRVVYPHRSLMTATAIQEWLLSQQGCICGHRKHTVEIFFKKPKVAQA